jgi:catechol 2,3-dioxygenase-like lactoylglutathione lyase family enzyme
MAVRLDHTIVPSYDKHASAEFLARILGIGPPGRFGHFVTLKVANGVSLDYDDASDVRSQHYAFLVGDEDFDPIFDRVKGEDVTYYSDPGHSRPGEINARDGGRGFYFSDPDGHNMEVLTRPYGSANT